MATAKLSDLGLMTRAVALSKKGFPAPNPHVGCVIAKDGEIVGRGYHAFAGGPHAEIVALAEAGSRAQNADAFVTLAPCNHTGRTPPCSEALIQAGVRRVIVAMDDPNPIASGGVQRLREAGIDVQVGLLQEQAKAANHQFLCAIQRRKPYVVGKAAVSLDGRIALENGESRWITGERSRRAAHRLRAELGAVLVGRRTVEMDDPELTARIPNVVNPPLRIVLDPHARLSSSHKVFNDRAETWHITGDINLSNVLERLISSGRTGLLVEGGGKTLAEFLKHDLVEEIRLFVAPRILGDGPAWVEGLHLSSLSHSPLFDFVGIRAFGLDREFCLRRAQMKQSGLESV